MAETSVFHFHHITNSPAATNHLTGVGPLIGIEESPLFIEVIKGHNHIVFAPSALECVWNW